MDGGERTQADATGRAEWAYPLLAASLVLALSCFKHRRFFHDDAFITLRYARHLAEHGLPHWNLGESAEGFTSPLHLAAVALSWLSGLRGEAGPRAIGLASAGLLLYSLVVGLVRLRPGRDERAARLIVAVAVAASPPLAAWTVGGLDAIMVSAFLAAAVAATLDTDPGRARRAGLWFALAALTRLDALVFIGAFSLVQAGPQLRSWLPLLGPTLFAIGAQFAVRWSLSGTLFPLTFYAKVGIPADMRFRTGADYLLVSLGEIPLVMLGVGVALFEATRADRRATALAAALIAHVAYVTWSGGDHMPAARPLLTLFVPAAFAVARASAAAAPAALTATALTVLIAALAPALTMDRAAFYGTVIGPYVDTHWPRGITVALNGAGGIPFYADDRVYIDMLGLNDPIIARRDPVPFRGKSQWMPGHAKGDGKYVLSRRPERIIFGAPRGSDPTLAVFLSDVEIGEDPNFLQCYRRQEAILDVEPEAAWRADYTDKLQFVWYERACP